MFRSSRLIPAACLGILFLTAILAGAAIAEPRHDRQGFFMGLDLGAAGSGFEFDKGHKTYEYDDQSGAALGVRLGYAFNPYVSLSLEGRGFGYTGNDFDYNLCTRTLSVTVYPAGGGFYLRTGLGASRFETELHDDNDDAVIEEIDEDGGAIALGLGYDWMLNQHFAIGLGAEARGAAFDDFGDFEDFVAAESSLGLTMNYYF